MHPTAKQSDPIPTVFSRSAEATSRYRRKLERYLLQGRPDVLPLQAVTRAIGQPHPGSPDLQTGMREERARNRGSRDHSVGRRPSTSVRQHLVVLPSLRARVRVPETSAASACLVPEKRCVLRLQLFQTGTVERQVLPASRNQFQRRDRTRAAHSAIPPAHCETHSRVRQPCGMASAATYGSKGALHEINPVFRDSPDQHFPRNNPLPEKTARHRLCAFQRLGARVEEAIWMRPPGARNKLGGSRV